MDEEIVIYLPEYDEIICFRPCGMGIFTREGFSFPLRALNENRLIQVVLGDL